MQAKTCCCWGRGRSKKSLLLGEGQIQVPDDGWPAAGGAKNHHPRPTAVASPGLEATGRRDGSAKKASPWSQSTKGLPEIWGRTGTNSVSPAPTTSLAPATSNSCLHRGRGQSLEEDPLSDTGMWGPWKAEGGTGTQGSLAPSPALSTR